MQQTLSNVDFVYSREISHWNLLSDVLLKYFVFGTRFSIIGGKSTRFQENLSFVRGDLNMYALINLSQNNILHLP